ncbi:MAG: translation initiation factor IF-3 [Bacteroidia bacterium]|nr:translation initiation factor IF-3 [Bacteroidia bacterium]
MGRRRTGSRKPTRINKEPEHRINHRIRVPQVRLVSIDGETANEIVSTRDALARAESLELDLVEISPNANPPVVKIMEYSKFMYEIKKQRKAQKAKQATTEVKELRFGPNTDEHDLNFKLKHAEKFLQEGNKLKVYVQFKGRSIIYKDRGRDVLKKVVDSLSEYAKVESPPQMNGRRMTMMLAPK